MKLSAALIVRNEEANLQRCMESIKDLVDEIVIVDTGSTDKTVEIAMQYATAVYHEKWRDDFAWHRNHSFSKCTGDWILQIDADEVFKLDPRIDPKDFKAFIASLKDIDAIALKLKDWRNDSKTFVGEIDLVRIFKKGCVTYKRRIHNEPVFKDPAGYISIAHLVHYGNNLTEEQRAVKAKRTIGLLELTLQEDPTDYDSHFYLAQAYLAHLKNWDKAIEHATIYLSHVDDLGPKFNDSIYHLVASYHIKQKQYDKARQLIKDGFKHNAYNVDLAWDLAEIGLGENNMALIVNAANLYFQCMEKIVDPAYRSKFPGRIFFHVDANSQAAMMYYLGAGQLDNGITMLRRLTKMTHEKCASHVQQEIDQRIEDTLNRLGLVDQTASRIVLAGNVSVGGAIPKREKLRVIQ